MAGWAIQGPANSTPSQKGEVHWLHISPLPPTEALHRNVKHLWQLDILRFRSAKISYSADKEAMEVFAKND